MKAIRVLIIETHPQVRKALAARLRTSTVIEVVDATADADDGLKASLELNPDVVLVDSKAARHIGPETGSLLNTLVQTKNNVIILATYSDENERRELLRAGARHYLLKDVQSEFLIDTILSLAEGGAGNHAATPESSELSPKNPHT